jgi:hypothetical protein
MDTMQNIRESLKEERERLQKQLNAVDSALRILGHETHGREVNGTARKKGGAHISAAGRKRLSEMMKKRWAERRAKLRAKR